MWIKLPAPCKETGPTKPSNHKTIRITMMVSYMIFSFFVYPSLMCHCEIVFNTTHINGSRIQSSRNDTHKQGWLKLTVALNFVSGGGKLVNQHFLPMLF